MTSPVEDIPTALNAACTHKMCLLISTSIQSLLLPVEDFSLWCYLNSISTSEN